MKLHWREMWFCFQEFVFVSRETEDLKKSHVDYLNSLYLWVLYNFVTITQCSRLAFNSARHPALSICYRFGNISTCLWHVTQLHHSHLHSTPSCRYYLVFHQRSHFQLLLLSAPLFMEDFVWGHPRRCWGSCSPGKADMMSISWSRPKQLPEESGFFFCCANLVTRVMC